MNVLLEVLAGLPTEPPCRPAQRLGRQLEQWIASRQAPGTTPALALLAVRLWARLHGLVSLEIEGNFAAMGIDPAPLFEAELAALLAGSD
jgi:predicted cobalt transporter CbtA